MRLPTLWLAFGVVLSISLLGATPARAAACPVTLDWFWISASGANKGYVRYAIQISAASADIYTVRFSAVGPIDDMKHVVQASMTDTRWALLTFTWPAATLGALTVRDVTLKDGTQIQCVDAPAVAVLNSKDEVKPSFDDSGALWPEDVIAAPVPHNSITDAEAVRLVEPVYPPLDRNMGHQGNVRVAITVGPDGIPVRVKVLKSSGYSALDNAALDAARQNRYKPPTVDGIPNVQEYSTDYRFNLR